MIAITARLRRQAALAICLALAAAGPLAQDQSKTLFLVAKPGISDPNFRESVILVTQDAQAQATGVIINRVTDHSLAELLPGERFQNFTEPVFFGGPVAFNALFAVFRSEKNRGNAVTMLPGLHLALDPNTVDALLNDPPAKLRFYAGYSGWGPDQLRGELERGDWFVVDADADSVFRKDYSNLWREMVRRAKAVHADAGHMPVLHWADKNS